jgi:hypothetical protein
MPERVRVNFGGDPGRDDYGLPPVDIEIPDDARELDRDVHAYYRELRARRRRMLVRRLYAPLSRDGMVLPLLAGCLALTLLAGTLLTVLTTGQQSITTTTTAPPAPAKSPASAAVGTAGALLPETLVMVNGRQQPLRSLAGGVLVLVLVPPVCRCQADVQRVARLTLRAKAVPYLIGTQLPQLTTLAMAVGLGKASAVADSDSQLPPTFHPGTLTAVLVRKNGTVARFVANPARDPRFRAGLRSLTPGATLAPAAP